MTVTSNCETVDYLGKSMIKNKVQSNEKLVSIDIAKSFGPKFPLKSLQIDLKRIAKTLRNMHNHNIQHTYPVPKHIYLNKVNKDIVLIDLEKMKKRFFSFQASIRDLYAFLKYAREYIDEQDIIYFLKKYFKNQKPNLLQKFILKRVNKKLRS